jgi:hypothetical protein
MTVMEGHREFGIWGELERKGRLGNGNTGDEDRYPNFDNTETPKD